MTFQEFKEGLLQAAQNGTLMTAKHDPNNLGISLLPYRSVLSYELSTNLLRFINSENYTVIEYQNLDKPNSPLYFEIIPNINSEFDVPASGVTSYSTYATIALDRLVAVSGQTQGWHLFGEDSTQIQLKVQNGKLNFEGQL